MKPKISIILVNWNGLNDTLECLNSISKIDYNNFNVVVVDNGSADNSCVVIKKKFPEVVLIANKENRGFTGGNNIAIEYLLKTDTEYFFMLNNDTIVDPKILKEFIAGIKSYPKAGIYGGKVYFYHYPNKISFAGAMWDKKRNGFTHFGDGEIDDGTLYLEPKECDFITGCALFFSKKVVDCIGLLDEKFFAYYEETDWCYRARKKGFKCIYLPKVRLWHKISASTGEHSLLFYYYMTRNSFLWIRKNFLFFERQLMYFSNFCGIFFPCLSKRDPASEKSLWIKRLYWDLLGLSTKISKAKFSGFLDYILKKFGKCKKNF